MNLQGLDEQIKHDFYLFIRSLIVFHWYATGERWTKETGTFDILWYFFYSNWSLYIFNFFWSSFGHLCHPRILPILPMFSSLFVWNLNF